MSHSVSDLSSMITRIVDKVLKESKQNYVTQIEEMEAKAAFITGYIRQSNDIEFHREIKPFMAEYFEGDTMRMPGSLREAELYNHGVYRGIMLARKHIEAIKVKVGVD